MKRFALFAAAAALAAPAVFAQTPVLTLADVIDHSAVVISPPIATTGLREAIVVDTGSIAPVAIHSSSTAVLGGPAAPAVQIVTPGTAILDVPAYAVTRPDFQRWLAWERTRLVGTR